MSLLKKIVDFELNEIFSRVRRKALPPPPPDLSKRELCDGRPLYDGFYKLKPNGQQQSYVVLSSEERVRGFVRPVRRKYIHVKCGTVTTMSQAIAETYARAPTFYSGTFCVHCGGHFPVGPGGEFVWDDGSNEKVGT